MKKILKEILKKEKKEIEISTKIEERENYFHIVVNFWYDDNLLANLISKEAFETIQDALEYLSKSENNDIIEYRAITKKDLIYKK